MNCWRGICKYCRYTDDKEICSLDGFECDYKLDFPFPGFRDEHCRHESDKTFWDSDLCGYVHWFSCVNLCLFYDSCDEQ